MRFYKHIILLTAFFSITFLAEVANASYCEKKTHVFFGNGMFNTESTATKSLKRLESAMKSSGNLSEDSWVFDVSYNHDDKLFSIFKVFRQRQGESASVFWHWIRGVLPAPDWFREKALELATQGDLEQAIRDADLRRHVQRYKTVLLEGGRVLVVGHSQGCLYANSAYTALAKDSDDLPMGSFGIVAVGTPSSKVAGGGPHITLTNDLVINTVRWFYPGTLDGNVTNGSDSSDWKNHSFVDAYLDGDRSGPLIVSKALGRANGLAWPTPLLGMGPLTVTLTWGDEPDVDLHVFEPDGSHVYYAAPAGTSGYLDHDDVTSWGPEHYYVVDCESLAAGTYRVGVNYYRGSTPETANVQIQAGDIIKDYTLRLSSARGAAGDASPESVAAIEVVGDPVAGYTFTVEAQK
jgi:hypothetical protein